MCFSSADQTDESASDDNAPVIKDSVSVTDDVDVDNDVEADREEENTSDHVQLLQGLAGEW